MSTTVTAVGLVGAVAPVTRRVRAYFAPVNRAAGAPTVFDAAHSGTFALSSPPAPWVDLGWCTKFARKSETKIGALTTGAPAVVQSQVVTQVEATLQLEFESWGKLQLALAAGSQQMNLLQTATGAAANGSGGRAAQAVLLTGAAASTATALNVGAAAAAQFEVGQLVSVDEDYVAQVGFVGSGVSAAYVSSPASVANDINYIRRVSLNVGRVVSIANGVLQLGAPLLAGAPPSGMQVSPLMGFVDREGGGFFQEWSGLFVMDGEQGDRVIYHYPRLQAMQGSAEMAEALAGPLEKVKLAGAFRALPVKDANDGETVLCFRSYLPGAMRAV
ncbi:hypothetical protein [Tunturibacter empetritectus]|uniref:Uncharacterized protein n=1 Tax=Tunturiibacter empetritectus TaxID=3069691 RepID=A0A7W8IJZ4_9BACT|nr:hypothetical protein [Edaphobacter lichenicola]MBB5317603.1 hypothetical protein [Edaphobacter lichenicola]